MIEEVGVGADEDVVAEYGRVRHGEGEMVLKRMLLAAWAVQWRVAGTEKFLTLSPRHHATGSNRFLEVNLQERPSNRQLC
jgi:hypothetical protein